MKYARQSSGRGEYAHVKLRLHPGGPGTGVVFENRIIGGAIPARFITAVEEGIQDCLAADVTAAPIHEVRVQLCDGSYHDVDSTDGAFRTAAFGATEDTARKADPVLLEPVMRVDLVVPAECRDDGIRNVTARRGSSVAPERCRKRRHPSARATRGTLRVRDRPQVAHAWTRHARHPVRCV